MLPPLARVRRRPRPVWSGPSGVCGSAGFGHSCTGKSWRAVRSVSSGALTWAVGLRGDSCGLHSFDAEVWALRGATCAVEDAAAHPVADGGGLPAHGHGGHAGGEVAGREREVFHVPIVVEVAADVQRPAVRALFRGRGGVRGAPAARIVTGRRVRRGTDSGGVLRPPVVVVACWPFGSGWPFGRRRALWRWWPLWGLALYPGQGGDHLQRGGLGSSEVLAELAESPEETFLAGGRWPGRVNAEDVALRYAAVLVGGPSSVELVQRAVSVGVGAVHAGLPCDGWPRGDGGSAGPGSSVAARGAS